MKDNSNEKAMTLCKYSSNGLQSLLATKCLEKNPTKRNKQTNKPHEHNKTNQPTKTNNPPKQTNKQGKTTKQTLKNQPARINRFADNRTTKSLC